VSYLIKHSGLFSEDELKDGVDFLTHDDKLEAFSLLSVEENVLFLKMLDSDDKSMLLHDLTPEELTTILDAMSAQDRDKAMNLLEDDLVELLDKVEQEKMEWAEMSFEERGEANMKKMEDLGLVTTSDRVFFLKDLEANECAHTIGAMPYEFKKRVIDAMSKHDKVTILRHSP